VCSIYAGTVHYNREKRLIFSSVSCSFKLPLLLCSEWEFRV